MKNAYTGIGVLLGFSTAIWSSGAATDTHASLDGDAGKAVYEQTCIACHGADGQGKLPGIPDLTKADGRLSKPESDLVLNIMEGYESSDSLMAMPAKGGNPALSETDIWNVVQYMFQEFRGKDASRTARR